MYNEFNTSTELYTIKPTKWKYNDRIKFGHTTTNYYRLLSKHEAVLVKITNLVILKPEKSVITRQNFTIEYSISRCRMSSCYRTTNLDWLLAVYVPFLKRMRIWSAGKNN